MYHRLLLCLFISLFSLVHNAYATELSASVDRQRVALGESFTLSLQTQTDLAGNVDLRALEKDFFLLGQSTQAVYQVINGQSNASKIWRIELSPRHEGTLRIPSLQIGSLHSTPLLIEVHKKTEVNAGRAPVFLTTSMEPDKPYPNSQVSYKIKLFYSVELHQASLTEPKVAPEEIDVIPIDDDTHYQTTIQGKLYEVIERRYILIPKKSGTLMIQAPVLTVKTPLDNSPANLFNFTVPLRTLIVSGKNLYLQVRNLPPHIEPAHWLPAQGMGLSEKWSSDPAHFRVGEPITRTLILQGTGIRAEQLPSLQSPELTGLKYYPEKPQLNNHVQDGRINSSRNEKVAIIPLHAGKFTLPALNITWWNTQTHRAETITLPSQTISVQAQATTIESTLTTPPPPVATAHQPAYPWHWVIAVVCLATGWLSTMFFLWFRRTPNNRPRATHAYAKLIQACKEHDPMAAQEALLTWARQRWPAADITHLHAVSNLFDNANWRNALHQLETVIYAGHTTPWTGDALMQALKEVLSHKKVKKTRKKSSLAPLYPDA